MATTFKASINTKTLGNPKHLLGKHDMKDGQKQLLGTIIGRADGLVRRQDPKNPDQFFHGLSGTFEAVPADGSDAVGGASLFAPDIIHNQIAAKLEAGGKNTVVAFAYEAYVVAGGTAGFTWEYRFLGDGAEQHDPLAEVRRLISTDKVAKLEHKKPAKSAA